MSFAVLSLGGGVQSSTLAEMACDGMLEPLRAIAFADTGGELPETYRHVDYLAGRAAQAGIEFLTVAAGDLRTDLVARHGRGGQPNLPVRIRHADGRLGRLNHYRCSYDYKRRPITRAVKQLCGAPGAWKQARVEQWIGYSTDEASRMKTADQCRCGHNRIRRAIGGRPYLQIHGPGGCTRCGCATWEPWQVNRWPLIELGMSRDDCRAWLLEHGRPLPPRSSCWFCPNRPARHFVELKQQRPTLFAQAVALDEFLRHGINGLRGEAYLHQSGRPLAEVSDARPEPGDDARTAAMDCNAGVCFT
ncbi:MAG TPA: hypothetical protein VMB79_13495 [Jatrophihabitans sp.]|nr:hypothetical protein [Jatrophihabitans sp.]